MKYTVIIQGKEVSILSIRLSVPYREKDEAKALGAKRNPLGTYWYCEVLNEGLMRWYRGPHITFDDDGNVIDDNLTPDPTDNEAGNVTDNENENEQNDEENIFLTANGPINLAEYSNVSDISDMISNKYRSIPEFRRIMVKGEVTNYSGHSTHYFFDIKDDRAILHCFMYENVGQNILDFELENGQQVAIAGSFDLYQASGKSQLVVTQIANIGDGASMLAYIRLKERLEAEGLFLADHKKPIPKYPEKVGIITSKSGQAIQDICKVAPKRNPYVQLELYHVNVQGRNAVNTILSGIRYMDARGYDTIIIGRGGGGLEELMAYNNEAIARAVFEARTPIISAVGHQGHWTLIDYVADIRAATPSEAAEEAVPDVMMTVNRVKLLEKSIRVNMLNKLDQRKHILNEIKARLQKNSPERKLKEQKAKLEFLSKQINDNMVRITEEKKNHLILLSERIGNNMIRIAKDRRNLIDQLSEKLDNNIVRIVKEKRSRYDRLSERLDRNMLSLYKEKKHRFEILVEKLNGLSPTAKLVRGFGYISHDGKAVTTVDDVKAGDSIVMRIHDGEINADVTKINKNNAEL